MAKTLRKLQPSAIKIFAFILIAIFSRPAPAASEVTILAAPDVLEDYHRFLNKRNYKDVHYYAGENSRFDVVELVLLQQALHLGRFNKNISIKTEKSFKRIIQQVISGNVTLSGSSVWQSITEKNRHNLFISDDIVPAKKLETGLFTSPINYSALQVNSLEELREMRIVSNSNWTKSWSWLQSIGVEKLYNHTYWPAMVKMVASNRADVVMAPFPLNSNRSDLTLHFNGIALMPIPGVKVVNGGSRHFIVSKQHPMGPTAFQHLTTGLKILARQGVINRAFTESGVYTNTTKDWKIIGIRPD